jgi:diguanylate cyclase (GGDEF)-like protein
VPALLGWLTLLVAGSVALMAMLIAVASDGSPGTWNVAWTAAATCALAGVLLARRAASAPQRRYWSWWSAAVAAWLGGQIAWNVYTASGAPHSPSLADAAWWSFALLVMAGLLSSSKGSRTLRTVAVVEALPLVAAAMALSCALLWDDVAASSLDVPARMSALAYPVVYVAAAVLTLQAMLGGALRRMQGKGLRVVLIGMVIQALAFILWSEQLLDQRYVTGESAIDPLWVVGMLAIAAGGALCACTRDTRSPGEPALEPGVLGGVLPATTFALLVGALLHAELTGAAAQPRIALAGGLVISGAMLTARGTILERRLRRLLGRERIAHRLLADREAELGRLNERLVEDSRRDPLTGLRNRRALAEDLDRLADARRRGDRPHAFAICDVDRFKAYNDRLGHLAGDQALRTIAGCMRGALREGDVAYRYGGEEFVFVLRDATPEEAESVAERVRATVAAAALPHPDGLGGIVTVSVGVAAGAGEPSELLADADAALYQAKRAGRDRVALASGGAGVRDHGRGRPGTERHPLMRPLGTLLAIARGAADDGSTSEMLAAVAALIQTELGYHTVVVNLRDGDDLRVVTVLGESEARATLEGTTNPLHAWESLLTAEHRRCGAAWLPAGTRLDPELTLWQPPVAASITSDAWHPDDLLLLPMRDPAGELLGVISVDQPRTGRRPDDEDITLLMAVADYATQLLDAHAPVR